MSRGLLITLEGGEGCGKSTQIRLLAAFLKKKGKSVFITREPGGTRVGDGIRKVLLDNKNKKMTGICETLLYMASRAQLVQEVIAPRLKKGQIVLCDRWMDATVAYQGYGAGIDVRWIRSIGDKATGGIRPRLSIFLDLPLKEGLRRATSHKKADRMEQKNLAFHKKVLEGYRAIARSDARRFKRVSIQISDSVPTVHDKIKKEILHVL